MDLSFLKLNTQTHGGIFPPVIKRRLWCNIDPDAIYICFSLVNYNEKNHRYIS